ncbi:hypothetical protein BC834DRAFT_374687 [Gloeopeniophorella convolvens]|nr:hypothetical protein BC834DRAFT_374687 [Gloeopeniophorella convolvens]
MGFEMPRSRQCRASSAGVLQLLPASAPMFLPSKTLSLPANICAKLSTSSYSALIIRGQRIYLELGLAARHGFEARASPVEEYVIRVPSLPVANDSGSESGTSEVPSPRKRISTAGLFWGEKNTDFCRRAASPRTGLGHIELRTEGTDEL